MSSINYQLSEHPFFISSAYMTLMSIYISRDNCRYATNLMHTIKDIRSTNVIAYYALNNLQLFMYLI